MTSTITATSTPPSTSNTPAPASGAHRPFARGITSSLPWLPCRGRRSR